MKTLWWTTAQHFWIAAKLALPYSTLLMNQWDGFQMKDPKTVMYAPRSFQFSEENIIVDLVECWFAIRALLMMTTCRVSKTRRLGSAPSAPRTGLKESTKWVKLKLLTHLETSKRSDIYKLLNLWLLSNTYSNIQTFFNC